MDVYADILSRVAGTPAAFCIPRSVQYYDPLLRLYEQVGFGPPSSVEKQRWREQSVLAWSHIDTLLPGSTTVGIHNESLISSWGTVPLTSNLLYTHSVCMVKTLPGVVTLLAQALLSLTWFDRLPEMKYVGMGYSYTSRFTTQFQRPLSFTIPNQIELESILCVPEYINNRQASEKTFIVDFRSEDCRFLDESHCWVFDSFLTPYSGLRALHSVRKLTLRSALDATPLALILVHDGPPFLTAADVQREILVFPTSNATTVSEICQSLRYADEFREKALYVFVRPGMSIPERIEGEKLDRSFWVATERSQAKLLRRSYLDAFGAVIRKYPAGEISDYLALVWKPSWKDTSK